MLNNTEELSSDGDDDCFVPSKKALQISSDEEKTDSEEETVVRKIRGRNCKIPARTPRKTPSKKVCIAMVGFCGACQLLFFSPILS